MHIPLPFRSLCRAVAVVLLASAGAASAQQGQRLPASPQQPWLGHAIALQGNLALRSIRADLAAQLRAMPPPPAPLVRPAALAALSTAAVP